jgi:ABC-type transport system substrate-binding protein
MDDPARRQQALSDAQRRIVEQAYWVTLAKDYTTIAVSSRVQGAFWSEATGRLNLDLAWLNK